ncbi:MAG: class I SAM-dependent methyltransferase family protein [Candidatus Anstonellaceae archaeon]
MVLCAKVERKNAEKARQRLVSAGVFDGSFVPAHDEGFVYFAIKGKIPGITTAQKNLAKRSAQGKSLYDELKGNLTAAELNELVTSFDIVGDIAVVEIPPALVKREKLIAEVILKNHKNVKTVAKKTGGTAGEFRIRPVKVIAGEKKTWTIYRESGCKFELDLNKTYFSPRLGTERARIAELVKPKELVLVPFAGVGPFAIAIGKAVPSARVVGIELNPDAAEYFKRNVVRNKCTNLTAICGDVAKLLPGKYKGKASRAIMPLPKDAGRFLANAIPCLKKGGMLHYYSFGDARSPFAKAEEEVIEAAAKFGRKARVIFRRVVRPYSKEVEQVVVDAKVD